MDKKAAIQLSMTTIIVIVIGVTLLVLGMAFVRGIFGKISEMSDETFDAAQSMLGTLEEVNTLLTVTPTQTSVEQNKDKPIKVIVANFADKQITITGNTAPVGGDKSLDCVFFDTGKSKSDTYTIKSGGQERIPLIVFEQGGDLRTTGCVIKIDGAPEGEDNQETVVVRVEAAKGILG